MRAAVRAQLVVEAQVRALWRREPASTRRAQAPAEASRLQCPSRQVGVREQARPARATTKQVVVERRLSMALELLPRVTVTSSSRSDTSHRRAAGQLPPAPQQSTGHATRTHESPPARYARASSSQRRPTRCEAGSHRATAARWYERAVAWVVVARRPSAEVRRFSAAADQDEAAAQMRQPAPGQTRPQAPATRRQTPCRSTECRAPYRTARGSRGSS